MRTLGLIPCTCGHDPRVHERFTKQCLATDADRRYGRPLCGCLRFTEAPFPAQQLALFEGGSIRAVEVVGHL